jgi:hypothetical protein
VTSAKEDEEFFADVVSLAETLHHLKTVAHNQPAN